MLTIIMITSTINCMILISFSSSTFSSAGNLIVNNGRNHLTIAANCLGLSWIQCLSTFRVFQHCNWLFQEDHEWTCAFQLMLVVDTHFRHNFQHIYMIPLSKNYTCIGNRRRLDSYILFVPEPVGLPAILYFCSYHTVFHSPKRAPVYFCMYCFASVLKYISWCVE